MKAVKNILLLDKDPLSATQIINTLSAGKDAFAVQHAGGVTEGLSYLQSTAPDVVLLDGNMAESTEFAEVQAHLTQQHIPCILLSDKADKNIIGLAEKAGAREYVVKSGITPTHLLKTIVNTIKLSEAENRLNLVFEEYTGRISCFSQMLDSVSAGTVIVGKDGTVQYGNARASALMNHGQLKNKLAAALGYRVLNGPEACELPGEDLSLNVMPVEWDGKPCNLFVIENKFDRVTGRPDINFTTALFNTMHGNWVLLKGGIIEFANAHAAALMQTPAAELKGRRMDTLLSTPACRDIAGTEGKSLIGALTLTDGSSLVIKYRVDELNMDSGQYLLLELAVAAEAAGDELWHANTGNLIQPVTSMVHEIGSIIKCITQGDFARANQLAETAVAGAGQITGILQVFKNYLTLAGAVPEMTEVPVKAVVEEALQKLQTRVQASGAEINMSELPTIHADRNMVLQVVEQLLDNALRFSRHDKKPVIDIGHDKYEGSYIFCIRDNGMGISRKDHQVIFEAFAKLDANTPGNGLGLAICKNIAEKHGGKIWVESLPGHGSNFYFTLG